MTYIDGVLYAVPTAKRQEFLEKSEQMAKLFKEYGALQVVDGWGVDVPDGKVTSMPMAVKCQEDETVCIGWITWPSRETRNEAWDKIMQDERMQKLDMPFDGKRMIFGGFDMISQV